MFQKDDTTAIKSIGMQHVHHHHVVVHELAEVYAPLVEEFNEQNKLRRDLSDVALHVCGICESLIHQAYHYALCQAVCMTMHRAFPGSESTFTDEFHNEVSVHLNMNIDCQVFKKLLLLYTGVPYVDTTILLQRNAMLSMLPAAPASQPEYNPLEVSGRTKTMSAHSPQRTPSRLRTSELILGKENVPEEVKVVKEKMGTTSLSPLIEHYVMCHWTEVRHERLNSSRPPTSTAVDVLTIDHEPIDDIVLPSARPATASAYSPMQTRRRPFLQSACGRHDIPSFPHASHTVTFSRPATSLATPSHSDDMMLSERRSRPQTSPKSKMSSKGFVDSRPLSPMSRHSYARIEVQEEQTSDIPRTNLSCIKDQLDVAYQVNEAEKEKYRKSMGTDTAALNKQRKDYEKQKQAVLKGAPELLSQYCMDHLSLYQSTSGVNSSDYRKRRLFEFFIIDSPSASVSGPKTDASGNPIILRDSKTPMGKGDNVAVEFASMKIAAIKSKKSYVGVVSHV